MNQGDVTFRNHVALQRSSELTGVEVFDGVDDDAASLRDQRTLHVEGCAVFDVCVGARPRPDQE